MSRAVSEWIGKTDDDPIPPRVRIRVFERASKRCQDCGRSLHGGDRWEADHIVAIINGGENREQNLQCLCAWCHKSKSSIDVAEKSMVNRKRSKHLGLKRKSRFLGSRDSGWKIRLTSEGNKPEKRDG